MLHKKEKPHLLIAYKLCCICRFKNAPGNFINSFALSACLLSACQFVFSKRKYVVGCTNLMTGGPSKEDGCFLRVYYPSQIKDVYEHSSRWASWLLHPKYVEDYTIVLGMIPFFGKKLISWAFGNSYIPIALDAELCNEQRFPVIVFSHGLTACRTAYSTFCSDISSHGFIVAAIEHRDGSACMTYSLETEPNSKGGLVESWIPGNDL
ncbi:platelet-activating factor acetylhydrolase-like isoform X1 [Daphnia pulex]|uniref:platelet-activating factor acetylhydrolase-like isoform X1 n=1 Tax=Daphnia pulex TaxID=6669 RepID=UPI001EE0194B|nr:platelet-activating factor acetylhydrolase-like isoform X1 [Daphnia pulex]XP_046458272.1 platelet-activating factor acetylhydrolase-like isoform X1 [Daphnia pulex]